MKTPKINVDSPEYRDLVSKLVGKPIDFPNLPKKEIENIGFTGLKDTDLLILMELEDKELFEVCSLNKYLRSLCNNDYFWYNRIVKKYGEKEIEVAKQKNKSTWKKYYIHLIKSNLKLWFDRKNNFYLSQKKLNNADILLAEHIIIPKIGPKLYAYVRLDNNSILFEQNEILVFTDKKELQKYFNKMKNIKVQYIKNNTRELNLYL
jgi:hypothetical protein